MPSRQIKEFSKKRKQKKIELVVRPDIDFTSKEFFANIVLNALVISKLI